MKSFDKSLGDLLDEMRRIIKIENGVGLECSSGWCQHTSYSCG